MQGVLFLLDEFRIDHAFSPIRWKKFPRGAGIQSERGPTRNFGPFGSDAGEAGARETVLSPLGRSKAVFETSPHLPQASGGIFLGRAQTLDETGPEGTKQKIDFVHRL